jgi:(E)-4-hydroxy-3-methylbut-2-enyl-diphosphate synthase
MVKEFEYRRFPSREVRVGHLVVGGNHPIRIQTMVNTPPDQVEESAKQVIRLAEAGFELIRLTVPAMKDVESLKLIRQQVRAAGVKVPLVADVHFNAAIAIACAEVVEKVRINPGNFSASQPGSSDYSDSESYMNEISRVEELLLRLISVCRRNGTAVRIGSNHGSLSPRIMNRYGDTPLGMVEAALEFVRIFHRNHFHDLVLSMKSSNVVVMVQAYRLLAKKMMEEGFDYPIHLGVTEAGFGNEGCVKSAAGIGLLLEEGIGDTIRVSLTGDPLGELLPARLLAERYTRFHAGVSSTSGENTFSMIPPQVPRITKRIAGIGGGSPPAVIITGTSVTDPVPDYTAIPSDHPAIVYMAEGRNHRLPALRTGDRSLFMDEIPSEALLMCPPLPDSLTGSMLRDHQGFIPVLQISVNAHSSSLRQWIAWLDPHCPERPVILMIDLAGEDSNRGMIGCTVLASCLFTDGQASGLWIKGTGSQESDARLAFMILQATRARITAPEYISCPSCGRTRFNILEVAEKIRSRTSHLTGLRIAIMGCIVNGPGEMADADYGYVGSGKNTVTLYKGKTVMKRGIQEDEAIEALLDLIKENNDWREQ